MGRLTNRKDDWYWKDEEFWFSAENPTLDELDGVYYKLAEFEDFMEKYDFQDINNLENYLKKMFQENQALKDRWNKLKEYIYDEKEEVDVLIDPYAEEYEALCNISGAFNIVIKKMKELENEVKNDM